MTRWAPDRVAFGGDWNPEQWPVEEWEAQVRALDQAKVNLARVGVFSWSLLQPGPDEWDFAWLDHAMALLHERRIDVVLATSTASPPPWFSRMHPESRVIDERGYRHEIGSRQNWCPSSPVFRQASLTLVRRLAERYVDHPALRMWHTNNELGCHNAECFCEHSATAFRVWLRDRYRTIARLNEAWGARFWSQSYASFDEVAPPAVSTTFSNPTHVLDWRRFCSDALLAQHVAEREVLRDVAPGIPVTTNFMIGTGNSVGRSDYFRWAASVDVVANDHYEVGWDSSEARLHEQRAWSADFTRGVAGGAPWFLMEHAPSGVNWQTVNRTRPPGELRRATMSYLARGADAACFFQLVQSTSGAEKYHSAIVPHAGTDSRAFREACALGEEVARLAEAIGSTVHADTAMLVDWESAWALQHPTMPSNGFEPFDIAKAAHRALTRAGATVDMRHPRDDLSSYRFVVVPGLYLCDDELGDRLEAMARKGARILVTCLSGIADATDRVRGGGYPGAFRRLLGVRGEAFAPLPAGRTVAAVSPEGAGLYQGRFWQEELTADAETEVLARWNDGAWAGQPALTRRSVGSGFAWYLPSIPDPDGFLALARSIRRGAEPSSAPDPFADLVATTDVEVVRRRTGGVEYVFALNHGDIDVTLPALEGRDILTGQSAASWKLRAGDVRVIRTSSS
ncbi:hypothetical protein RSA3_07695 [Microbacterium testaceum]|uniref:Beta-galactosidase n=2 Tax=Microbacterium testaceum TaxID=2033 RepID=A0A147F8D5_MICTE|nr:hypothetical protein RSA3_07695 [Microbacterium testaceum]KTS90634.1 hypothetical protein NS183_08055 [Microbacterium testaceum]